MNSLDAGTAGEEAQSEMLPEMKIQLLDQFSRNFPPRRNLKRHVQKQQLKKDLIVLSSPITDAEEINIRV